MRCRLPEELVASIVNDVTEHDADPLYGMACFFGTALREFYRVEIRGIGAFNVHQRKKAKCIIAMVEAWLMLKVQFILNLNPPLA